MRKWINKILLVTICVFFAACSLFGGGEDEEEPVPVSFTATANPEDAGRVTPISLSLESGDSVTVEAIAFTESGYAFANWSGDLQSTDNPFSFVINSDTELIANFEPTSSEYEMFMSVADTTDTLDALRFGQMDTATDGIDGEDKEAPPPPPQDELHAYFLNDVDLFWDYRTTTTESITWDLQLQPGLTDSLFFSWELNETSLNGSLIMRSEDSSIEVDMAQKSELSIHSDDASHLLIEYQLGGN